MINANYLSDISFFESYFMPPIKIALAIVALIAPGRPVVLVLADRDIAQSAIPTFYG
jgi:hypothetical protein